MTARELVKATLEFRNSTGHVPKHMWVLPWANYQYPGELERINHEYPDDIVTAPAFLPESSQTHGERYEIGEYQDEWGCWFINLQRGIVGEVKQPLVPEEDEEWEDISSIHIPTEQLSFDTEAVRDFCQNTDQFVLAGCRPNPFERLQYIRGTEQLYVDLMFLPQGLLNFIKEMHEFYKQLVEKWATTEVDGIMFMDDWGSQNSLLINPAIWIKIFKPMYQDYIDIAHRHGKKAFMHSDGNILEIYPHLIEMGLDALNSQIFCMGIENLEQYRGKITFWGEIDRQHILSYGSKQDVTNAVEKVYHALWNNGGCIAQCEFGPGANPENVYTAFETWRKMK